ncbi:MAG: helix-hairpin-helix domain-containing protein [Candidatus Omnitrophica bacterium]|nr:helix-hairpin-helix domain-containing protein [Candidatus Omnitrophota bacterium]
MFFLTDNERKILLFLGTIFFAGLVLQLCFRLSPPLAGYLNLLDKPVLAVRLNINTASYEEFLALPGIGPSAAGRIMAFRQKNGAFQSVDDIQKAGKIKAAAFAKIRPHLAAPRQTLEKK